MDFPVVAFASSAGGLEALLELLPALPANGHMAYVVIQHLDREHKSLLAELLAKKTSMPVQPIENGLTLRPAHLYVIPPNVSVTLENDRFRLFPREDTRVPHHPADMFFQSLAERRGDGAIAVVLSGGDSDGTYGTQVIKESGGITFAQAPESAKFPSMPQNAINTGYVDYVLSPQDIGTELARLDAHPYLTGSVREENSAPIAVPEDEELALKGVFRLIYDAHGVEFQQYKRSTLERRLARRMAVRKADDLKAYVDLLREEPAEIAALYQDFLIRVTSFFRDPGSFELLRSRVLPHLCEGRSIKEPIRIWIPGCATGEEVYSIAMALLEYLGDRGPATPVQIFGTDISEAAIDRARAGIYSESIAENVSSARLQRFFVKEDGHYRLNKSVRELCLFARHDVTRDPPFSRLDLVSCRNLLIYLDAPAQRRIMQMFHYALRPLGFLMLGQSESIGSASSLFELIDKQQRLYTRKSSGHRNDFDFTPREKTRRAAGSTSAREAHNVFAEIESIQLEADRFLLTRYAPASLLLDESLNILQFRGDTSPYLEHSSGAASFNLHRVVRPELLVEISPAIQEARDTGRAARREALRVANSLNVTMEVVPFKTLNDERCFLVIFNDESPTAGDRRTQQTTLQALSESEKDRRLAQLEREIASTREYLQATIERHDAVQEELKSAHEEVLSANEEFQSSNEELETAKEEVQSSNEELTTTNDELRSRNRDLALLNTEIQGAREAAVRAQAYAEAITESVREPLVVLDANLVVLRANRAFYREMKSRRPDTEGVALKEIDAGQWNVPGLMQQLEAVLTQNLTVEDFPLSYFTVSGAPSRRLLVNARKIAGDSERAQMILLAIDDVTARDADAEQLRNADRRKDEFLAMLAHELRNPLTPITHAIRLLKRSNDSHSVPQLYDMIERQTHRLVRLVDELLDIARISRGHIELQRERVDLGVIARQAAEAARPRLEERRHELSLSVPPTPVTIEGDAVRLEQILANLLENSAKYTEPGGLIQLRVTQSDHEATLSVRDNGIGIAPENLKSIFELFRQVDSSLARSGGGLGIGLTLVQRVLELHGGRIEARSAGLGHGTEFIVQLPLANPLAASAAKPDAAHSLTDGNRGSRVLIVDDNADAGETVALLARHWGHEVCLAYDGPSALQLAVTFRPEHALVDIGLPGMDGYELARQLRAQYPEAYLVAMTGYGRDEDRAAAYAAGFDAHLVKPADLDELQRILAEQSNQTLAAALPQ